MRGMRTIVAHDYANVDLRIVWEVATVYVPGICTAGSEFASIQTILGINSLSLRSFSDTAISFLVFFEGVP